MFSELGRFPRFGGSLMAKANNQQWNDLDASIASELSNSLEKIAKAIQDWAEHQKVGGRLHASPLAYAAYYDLALAAQRLLATQTLSSQSGETPLSFTTLSTEFYSLEDIAAINRWLDIEPENAMGLTAVSPKVLEATGQHIKTALCALELGCPQTYKEFTSITREIIVARSGLESRLSFRGASSFALWGALAINPEAHSNWWDYLPTLVHESAHSVLFALARSGPLVLNSPEDRYFSPLRNQARPMDGIYHAAFVSAREAWALSRCLENEAFISCELVNEQIIAKLTRTKQQSLASFHDCMAVIRQHGKLTPLGETILKECSVI